MKPASHPDALRIQSLLGLQFSVVEFEDSTKSSADAAAAIGCSVAEIAKSIVFKTVKGQEPVLVIASGSNRVDEKKISALLGEKVKSADAEFVQRVSGFIPGGVAPVGHLTPPKVFLDQDLKAFTTIWAAAGTPNAVFELSFADLERLTGGVTGDVAKAP
ncbi:YbaK/EbsC family protein [Aestuariivirga sp.]|uniref:YbaK/EbsC family protein n=1 Tax=Aestuariivirga sp. TaxID=2650926 RepID=UPI0039E69EF0